MRSIKHIVRCSSASEFTNGQRPESLRLFRAYLYSSCQFDKSVKTQIGENVRFGMHHNESDPDNVKYVFERGAFTMFTALCISIHM